MATAEDRNGSHVESVCISLDDNIKLSNHGSIIHKKIETGDAPTTISSDFVPGTKWRVWRGS